MKSEQNEINFQTLLLFYAFLFLPPLDENNIFTVQILMREFSLFKFCRSKLLFLLHYFMSNYVVWN